MQIGNDKWIGTGEAAQMLGCTKHTVRNMLKRGDLEGIRVGVQLRIEKASVEKVLVTPAYAAE